MLFASFWLKLFHMVLTVTLWSEDCHYCPAEKKTEVKRNLVICV